LELELKENTIKNFQTVNNRLMKIIKERELKNSHLGNEFLEMEVDIEKLVHQNCLLENTIKKDEDKYNELKMQFDDMEKKVCTDMKHKISILQNDNEKLTSSLANKSLEIETWKGRYEESELINTRKCKSYDLETHELAIKNESLTMR